MVGKEFTYRGKTLTELKEMNLNDFAKLLPSRQRRSIIRNSAPIEKFIKTCNKKIEKGKIIKTHLRDIIIVPKMIGMVVNVYAGKEFTEVRISDEMIGHRIGEFTQTRKKIQHGAPGIGATRGSSFLSVK